jgi:hypothetical protein
MNTIISFDIGIKNLAYCVFSLPGIIEERTFCASDRHINMNGTHDTTVSGTSSPASSYPIAVRDWNIINLIQQDIVEKPKCNCLNAKGGVCGKTATYKFGQSTYCLTHAKSSGKLLPSKDISPASFKKKKLDELADICLKHHIETTSCDKKATILEKVIAHFEARTLAPIILEKSKNANQIHLVEIGKRIKTQLDMVFYKYNPTHVILENQISPIAGRMNTIQGMVAQYFIMRDRSDKLSIDFISSAGKLKGFIKDTTKEAASTNTYKDHKRDGIAFCGQFMTANPGLATYKHIIDASTKKDDLADCFLQGIYFLRQKNMISYTENLQVSVV